MINAWQEYDTLTAPPSAHVRGLDWGQKLSKRAENLSKLPDKRLLALQRQRWGTRGTVPFQFRVHHHPEATRFTTTPRCLRWARQQSPDRTMSLVTATQWTSTSLMSPPLPAFQSNYGAPHKAASCLCSFHNHTFAQHKNPIGPFCFSEWEGLTYNSASSQSPEQRLPPAMYGYFFFPFNCF